MVDWKNVGTPIIVAIITLIGGFFISYISSVLYKPDVSIELVPSKEDVHNATINLLNKGSAPAKNLKLTMESPHNIVTTDIFGTENYTKRYTNSSSLEVDIPRFAQGKGSLITIAVSIDPHSSIDTNDHYTVYTTYDQGSDMNIEYVLPRPPSPPSQSLRNTLDLISSLVSSVTPIAGIITTAAGLLGGLAAFIQWIIERRRRKQAGQSNYDHQQ